MTDNDHPDTQTLRAQPEDLVDEGPAGIASEPWMAVVVECPDPASGMVAYRWWPPAD